MKGEVWIFKAINNIPSYQLCLGGVSKDFAKDDMEETALNCDV